jgi:beta-aspartyl-peptidase (threonine type)
MTKRPAPGIVVHGGAGDGWRSVLSPAGEKGVRAAIRRAVGAGRRVLEAGGSALDAAVAAVVVLEDDPHFNAGRGASRNRDGVCELDAAVMDGSGPGVGAVAGVRHVRNPVKLARAVMEQSGYVFLIGAGAERFAREAGLRPVSEAYFHTAASCREWQLALGRQLAARSCDTVGAVALDAVGNLAAATSTGGVVGKRPGRVGDCPVVGAGTYADNSSCAVSATGIGEHFVRLLAAREIAGRVLDRGETPIVAAKALLRHVVAKGGLGGFVVIDRRGRFAAPFTPDAMPRGWWFRGKPVTSAIWRED